MKASEIKAGIASCRRRIAKASRSIAIHARAIEEFQDQCAHRRYLPLRDPDNLRCVTAYRCLTCDGVWDADDPRKELRK